MVSILDVKRRLDDDLPQSRRSTVPRKGLDDNLPVTRRGTDILSYLFRRLKYTNLRDDWTVKCAFVNKNRFLIL